MVLGTRTSNACHTTEAVVRFNLAGLVITHTFELRAGVPA